MWMIIALVAVAAWAFWVATEINKPSGCGKDCYQGRYCTCNTPPDKDWPFPTKKEDK